MVHIILEIDPLRDDLAGQQRRKVIPRVARKLQREARHWQAPSIEGHVSDVHFTILQAMLMPSSEGQRHEDAFLCFAPTVTPTRS
jgi:hypothetical protein